MLRTRLLLTCALLALASLVSAAPEAKNTGCAVDVPAGDVLVLDDRLLWLKEEALHGDLNGDGDRADHVAHVYDLGTGSSVNLGIAAVTPMEAHRDRAEAGRFFFRADEAAQEADFNFDGDQSDVVVQLVDGTNAVTNVGHACNIAAVVDDLLVIPVDEYQEGATDLNGDGDLWDEVLVTIDLVTGTLTNLGLIGTGFTSDLRFNRNVLLALESEGRLGADLNGDGDTLDRFLTRVNLNTGSAIQYPWTVLSVGNAANPDEPYRHHGRSFCFLSRESFQGADLNADGDQDDDVLFRGRNGGSLINTGIATTPASPIGPKRGRAVFLIDEADGGMDVNGDGDQNDRIAIAMHLHSGGVINSRIDVLQVSGAHHTRYVCYKFAESGSSRDVNGDGDLDDLGIVYFDHDLRSFEYVPMSVSDGRMRTDGNHIAFQADEFHEGVDLNGDGDWDDAIVHLFEPSTGALDNTLLDATIAAVDGGMVLCHLSEQSDWNGDGDLLDEVAFLAAPGGFLNTGLAFDLSPVGPSPDLVLRNGTAWVPVSEAAQGQTDLNGDKDSDDYVVHVVR